ncbi:MAG: AAA family ATPase [Acidobacteriota bacterium]
MPPSDDLELLIRSRYPILVVDSVEESRVEAALRRAADSLGMPLFTWTVVDGLRRVDADGAVYDTLEPAKALANALSLKGEAVFWFKDLHDRLEDPMVRRLLQDLAEPFSRDRRTLVLSGADVRLSAPLARLAARTELALPGPEELERMARRVLRELLDRHRIEVDLGGDEMRRLVHGLRGLTLFEAERALSQVILRDMALTIDDTRHVARIKAERVARDGVLEIVPVEADDAEIGGLEQLRSWLRRRRRALRPEAREFGLPAPRGILLLGVQGCGKSLTARAVAADWGVPLLRLDAGRLYDRWVGASERNLERALRTAEALAPCVLLVDEIEKALDTGSGGGDAGLSRRILARLLGWLQERQAPVFVVATCNDATALPPELMRKGRFDETFFVDLPDAEARGEILALQLGRRRRDPGRFDLGSVVEATAGFSGAELESLVVAALHSAFAEGRDVDTGDLLAEAGATRPLSVTRGEEIEALRSWARGRAVPADDSRAA